MNRLTLLTLTLLSFGLCACRTYVTPAILGHNVGYMPKPLTSDTSHTKTYVNAAYGVSSSPGKPIEFEMGILNVSRAHTYKSINFSYGVIGYLGSAKYNDPDEQLPSSSTDLQQFPNFRKIASGFGIKTSIGFHDVSDRGNTDYRLLNWENAISTEMGSYASYRKFMPNGIYENTYISKMKTVWTTGLSSEIAWHPQHNKDFTHAFRVFLGWTPHLIKNFESDLSGTFFSEYGDKKPTNRVAFAYNYFLQFKRLHFTVEVASNINVASNLSLGYSF